jgi:polyisoprenoid-binding protein YceI
MKVGLHAAPFWRDGRLRAHCQEESMNAFNDRSMSGRSRVLEALCLASSTAMLAIGYGEAWAQSQASSSVAARDSVVYHLIPDSRFEVKTSKAGLFGFAGHEHVVRARAFNGYVVYFPDHPESSHLEVIILADSLEVLTPPDTAEIRQVTETMRTQVLHVKENPYIRFTASSDGATDKGMRLEGELTLLGRSRPVPVDATIQFGPDTIRASGTFSVKQTDFGIKPYSGGPAGTVKVGDRLTFTFDAIALRNSTSESARAGAPELRHRR